MSPGMVIYESGETCALVHDGELLRKGTVIELLDHALTLGYWPIGGRAAYTPIGKAYVVETDGKITEVEDAFSMHDMPPGARYVPAIGYGVLPCSLVPITAIESMTRSDMPRLTCMEEVADITETRERAELARLAAKYGAP